MRHLPDEAVPLLERFSDEVRKVMLALRTRILEVAPRAHETITDVGYTVALRFGSDAKMKTAYLYIAGFDKHANLGFTQGAHLEDPAEVLEGTGAGYRHVKFASAAQVRQAKWM